MGFGWFKGTFFENFSQLRPFWKMARLPVFWSGVARSGRGVANFYLSPNEPPLRSIRPPVSELCTFFYEFTGLPVSPLQGCQIHMIRCLLSLGGPNEYFLKIAGDSGRFEKWRCCLFFGTGVPGSVAGLQIFPYPLQSPLSHLGGQSDRQFPSYRKILKFAVLPVSLL